MAKKLLLADDSLTIQKVVGIVFANLDYKLLIADNGNAALDLARKEFPDLVLADIGMPGKDGLELCRELKNDAALDSIPVLLLPGAFDNFDEGKATAAGADGWLTKPFESQALISKVEELLAAAPGVAVAAPAFISAPPTPTPAVAAPSEPVTFEEPISFEEPNIELSTDADDDIWDAVSFEEEDLQAETAEPLTSVESPVAAAVAAPPAEDPIQFEEPAVIPQELAPAREETTDSEVFDLGTDDIFELEDDSIVEELTPELKPIAAPAVESADFFAAAPPAIVPAPLREPAPLVEPLDEVAELRPEPVIAPPPVAASVAPPVAPVAAPEFAAVEDQLRNLPDADLEAVINRVAGPIIERLATKLLEQVVWEVVPDLAESMVRDEIRKIKDGIT